MCADGFDYRTAAGLHRDRLNEAKSNRLACAAIKAKKAAKAADRCRAENAANGKLKQLIGKQLIALGERMTA